VLSFAMKAAAQSGFTAPASLFYIGADVCGQEPQSQFVLLRVGNQNWKFGSANIVLESYCPGNNITRSVTAYSNNASAIAALNAATNNCSGPVFRSLLNAPYDGMAPAGSVILLFTGSNPDLSGMNPFTFFSLCGGSPVLVVFGNYTGSDPFFNNYQNNNPSCGAYSGVTFKGSTFSQQELYEPLKLANKNGAFVAIDQDKTIRYGVSENCGCLGLTCPQGPTIQFSGDLDICEGQTTTITANAGAGYNYVWSTGATTAAIQVKPEVSSWYYVTVSSSANPQCERSAKVRVEVLGKPSVSLSALNETKGVACLGQTVYLNAAIEQVQTSYTTQWSPPHSGVVISPNQSFVLNQQSAGLYTHTITFSGGCVFTEKLEVSFPTPFPVKVCTNAPLCTGDPLSLEASAQGSQYQWSGPGGFSATGQVHSVDTPVSGAYSVTVTDAQGCTGTGSAVVVIKSCTGAVLSGTAASTNTTCGLNNGAVAISANGGEAPYSYDWSHIPGAGQGAAYTNLQAGTYTVTVGDAAGSTVVVVAQVAGSTAVQVSATAQATNCALNNGAINLSVSGGTPTYTYNWADLTTAPEPQNRSDLAAGTYSVTVSDINNCSATASASVAASTGASVMAVITPVSCFGGNNGAIDVSVSGGASPYTYNWADLGTSPEPQDRSNLSSGVYYLTVSASNGCTATASYGINQPAALGLSASSVNASCNLSNGSINLSASGGTGAYIFDWADISGNNNPQNRSALAAGVYTVTLSDANACTISLTRTLTQSGIPTLSAVLTPVACFNGANGAINVSSGGGLSPYTFNWADLNTNNEPEDRTGLTAGAYTLTLSDAAACTVSATWTVTQPSSALSATLTPANPTCGSSNGSITTAVSGGSGGYTFDWADLSGSNDPQNRTNIPAGTYTVTITDSGGCTLTRSATLSGQGGPTLSTVITNVSCNGGINGAINLIVSGGTTPYTYNWADITNGPEPEDRTNLFANTYSVTVTSANGCTATGSWVVTQPTALNVSFALVHTACGLANGAATAIAAGGVTPYQYDWSLLAGTNNPTIIDSLPEGGYMITVSDANGCTKTGNASINGSIPVNLTSTVVHTSCGNNNGAITVGASGGGTFSGQNLTYAYDWAHIPGNSNVPNQTNLWGATFHLTVTASTGCTASGSWVVEGSTPVNTTAQVTHTSCNLVNGAIVTSVSGGTYGNNSATYSYLWSNSSTASNLSNLLSGTYTVTVTSGIGCTKAKSWTINPSVGSPSVSGILQDEMLTLTVTGGVAPYSYIWSTGATTQNINNVISGTYTVTVTGDNDCHTVKTFIFAGSMPAGVSVNVDNSNANNEYSSQTNILSGHTILVFPNPASRQFTVELPEAIGTCNIDVYDKTGRLVLHQLGSGRVNVNADSWASGMYEIRISAATDSNTPGYVWKRIEILR